MLKKNKVNKLRYEENAMETISVKSMPKELQIETTVRCNMDCIMCDRKARERLAKDMTLEEFKKIVDQLEGVVKLHMHGIGEPLLNKDFISMVAYAKSKNIQVCFNDNMSLLDRKKAEELINIGLDELRMSLDASDITTYSEIRKSNLYNTVIKNIKDMANAKSELKRALPVLKIVVVGMRKNLKQIPSIVETAYNLGIGEVVVQSMQTWSRKELVEYADKETAIFVEDIEKVKAVFQEAKEIAIKRKIKLILPPLQGTKYTCTWPWTSCFITADGYITPCCNCPDPELFNFGNIRNARIKDIWFGPEYEDFRKALKSEHIPEICSGCIIYEGRYKDYMAI